MVTDFLIASVFSFSLAAHAQAPLPTRIVKIQNYDQVLKSTGTLDITVRGPDWYSVFVSKAGNDGSLPIPETAVSPIHVEYSVPDPGLRGRFYIASQTFESVQEY